MQWKRDYSIYVEEKNRTINQQVSWRHDAYLHNALHPLERQVVIELHNIYIYVYRIPAINLAAFQHRDGLDRISFTEFNSFSTWKDLSVERIGKHTYIYTC